MFFEDDDLIKRNLERATALLEEGGDWDRKNRLKVYQAVYDMSMRRFEKAAKLFLDTLSTFTSYELFDYDTLIFYAVITSIFSLDRPTLHSKVILSPEVLGVIGTKPRLSQLLNSLYQSEYKEFFMALGMPPPPPLRSQECVLTASSGRYRRTAQEQDAGAACKLLLQGDEDQGLHPTPRVVQECAALFHGGSLWREH